MLNAAGVTPDATRDDIIDFGLLLVLDYLNSCGFDDVAEDFMQVCRERQPDGPSPDSWYKVAQKLSLADLLRKNGRDKDMQFSSVMETLVHELIRENRIKMRTPATVTVSIARPGGRPRAGGRTEVLGHVYSSQDLMGPPSAPGAKRAPAAGEPDAPWPAQDSAHKRKASPDPISPPRPVNGGRTPRNTVISTRGFSKDFRDGASATRESVSRAKEDASRVRSANSVAESQERGIKSPARPQRGGRTEPGGLKPPPPKFQYRQDISRRPHMSSESWIPMDMRMKMLQRNMTLLSGNMENSVRREKLREKNMQREQRSELEMERELERCGIKRKKGCALCEQVFSEVNLVLSVPYKAVVDLRMTWHKKFPPADGKEPKLNPTMLKPPQCYNEVRVCAFCSQLFQDQLEYRPTWDMRADRVRSQLLSERLKKEREYWDPLTTAEKDHEREFAEWERSMAEQAGPGSLVLHATAEQARPHASSLHDKEARK